MKQPLSLEDIIEYELAYIENPNALIFLENPELFRSKPHPHTTSPFNSSSTNLPCFDSIFDKEMDKNSRITKKVIKEEAIGYFSQEVSRTDWVDPKVLEIRYLTNVTVNKLIIVLYIADIFCRYLYVMDKIVIHNDLLSRSSHIVTTPIIFFLNERPFFILGQDTQPCFCFLHSKYISYVFFLSFFVFFFFSFSPS